MTVSNLLCAHCGHTLGQHESIDFCGVAVSGDDDIHDTGICECRDFDH